MDAQFKEHVAPLTTTVQELLTKCEATADKCAEQQTQICKIDTHYAQCLKAVCATQGISVKDMSGAAISREYARLIV